MSAAERLLSVEVCALSEVRIKFTREAEVRYISHLDLMKTFERAIRRSGVPVAYSKGFNPHMQMVFGLPLSVGVTSEAEYADIELEKEISPDEFKDRLNAALPEPVRITDIKNKTVKINIMASVTRASYDITVEFKECTDTGVIKGRIKEFLSAGKIMVKKQGKQGVRDLDIRPLIYEFRLEESESQSRRAGQVAGVCTGAESGSGMAVFKALVSAGSQANLKPDILMDAFLEGVPVEAEDYSIHRTGLFLGLNGEINPLDPQVL